MSEWRTWVAEVTRLMQDREQGKPIDEERLTTLLHWIEYAGRYSKGVSV